MAVAVEWNNGPDPKDFQAAQDYLTLQYPAKVAARIVRGLKTATTETRKAKDVLRASRLPLLPKDNKHVKHQLGKIKDGVALNLILLVRGEPLIIADGYHRACACYWASEDTDIRCLITDRPEGDDPADLARELYLAGWVGSGAPVSAAVDAGREAAVELFDRHPDDPAVLEATLQLGALDGVWAQVYDRREALYATHTAAVLAAWRELVARLDMPALVRGYRATVGLGEAVDQARREQATSVALAALLDLFHDAHDPDYKALIEAMESTILDGLAEGQAGAIALAASHAGHTGGVDFGAAFADARAAFAGLDQYSVQAHQWLQQLVKGAATDLGNSLASDSGDTDGSGAADSDTMASDATATIDSPQVRSVTAYTDWALGHAFTLGAHGAYAAMLIPMLRWITAGDNRVCPACEQEELNSPYPLLTTPEPPEHPGCRCTTVPASPVVSLGRFAGYLN